ncbi:uncharacterized protein LOC125517444 [Triticum urartu]|uniref:uncharacterized protein LOC125517444 n=1 Tax=Triticum urartu TaxID=4572 RepID=UPI002043CB55|nr:uncharacterized protein LOC125517444 [Triticum urartu]
MDPTLKSYLDKLADTLTKANEETRADIKELAERIDHQSTQVDALTAWKPDLEARLSKLQETVGILQSGRPSAATASAGGSKKTDLPDLSPIDAIHGPDGHGKSLQPRGGLSAGVVPPATSPANGTLNFHTPINYQESDPSLGSSFPSGHLIAGLGQASPSLSFPQFSGDNPKIWKTMCEQYFAMFQIHDTYFVPMATLHFTGSAAIWLQLVQGKLAGLDWEAFCTLLCTRFGRDMHQSIIRQFYALRQTSSVSDYIEQFENPMNHLISYSDAVHPLYFLTRFIEGLHTDIRTVVMVQRLKDLDTACALTILQEEVAEGQRGSWHNRHNATSSLGRARPSIPLALPPPPGRSPTTSNIR